MLIIIKSLRRILLYFCAMISIVLLGTGNVAKHLFDAFSKNPLVEVVQVVGRNSETLKSFGKATIDVTNSGTIADADCYIIAVSDDSIDTVSQLLINKNALILHTSGSVSLDALASHKKAGIFYPLQTLSKERAVDFETVPLCIEVKNTKDLPLLEELANAISNKVYVINSDQRKNLHLAAVFANNFTNYMYRIAHEICVEHQLPFDIIKPLITETAAKIQEWPPSTMQTGPARRHDQATIKKHLSQLRVGNQKEIYELLSESISNSYGEEL